MGDGERLVREIWGRWNSGDREVDDETFDPEIEIHSALTGQVYRGRDGVGRWMAEIDDQFETWDLRVDEITERDPTTVVARGAIRMRGRSSGVVLDQPASWVLEVVGGRVVTIRNFIGRDAADQA